jgi:hypothetical protein
MGEDGELRTLRLRFVLCDPPLPLKTCRFFLAGILLAVEVDG